MMFSDGEFDLMHRALGFAAGVYNKKSRIAGTVGNKSEAQQFFEFSTECQTIALQIKAGARLFHKTKNEIIMAALRTVADAWGDDKGPRANDVRARLIAKNAAALAEKIQKTL